MFAVCSDRNRRNHFYLHGPTTPNHNVNYAYGYNDSKHYNPFNHNDSRGIA